MINGILPDFTRETPQFDLPGAQVFQVYDRSISASEAPDKHSRDIALAEFAIRFYAVALEQFRSEPW